MPRAVAGVHKMRVSGGDQVYILAHRLPFVAWRGARWSERKRVALLSRLQAQEMAGQVYTTETCFHTALTGLLKAYDSTGHEYTVHHTDVVRV